MVDRLSECRGIGVETLRGVRYPALVVVALLALGGGLVPPATQADGARTGGASHARLRSPAHPRGAILRRSGAPGHHPLSLRLAPTAGPPGRVYAWGNNNYGELGDGTTTESTVPTPTLTLSTVVSVAGGGGIYGGHSLALLADGSLWAWGDNSGGQLGNGAADSMSTVPVAVHALTGTTAITIASGYDHNLALGADGTVWAWGSNSSGQLGTGTCCSARNTPTQIPGFNGVTAIAAGLRFSLALKSDGTVWSWGSNQAGQLGNGATGGFTRSPTQVQVLSHTVAIAAGYNHSLALDAGGTVYAWGAGDQGELGSDAFRQPVPAQVGGISGVIAIAAGKDYSLALKSDGTVWSWGHDTSGQLGAYPTNTCGFSSDPCSYYPLLVNFPGPAVPIRAINAGSEHGMALGSDGAVYTWGNNAVGQLGQGAWDNNPHYYPQPALNLGGVGAIGGGGLHSLAVVSPSLLQPPTTPTPVPTATDSPTTTPAPTTTPTATPTSTPPPSPTLVPAGAPTAQPTDTPTNTQTPTPSPTTTATPAATATVTPTGTPTYVPTQTPIPPLTPTIPPAPCAPSEIFLPLWFLEGHGTLVPGRALGLHVVARRAGVGVEIGLDLRTSAGRPLYHTSLRATATAAGRLDATLPLAFAGGRSITPALLVMTSSTDCGGTTTRRLHVAILPAHATVTPWPEPPVSPTPAATLGTGATPTTTPTPPDTPAPTGTPTPPVAAGTPTRPVCSAAELFIGGGIAGERRVVAVGRPLGIAVHAPAGERGTLVVQLRSTGVAGGALLTTSAPLVIGPAGRGAVLVPIVVTPQRTPINAYVVVTFNDHCGSVTRRLRVILFRTGTPPSAKGLAGGGRP